MKKKIYGKLNGIEITWSPTTINKVLLECEREWRDIVKGKRWGDCPTCSKVMELTGLDSPDSSFCPLSFEAETGKMIVCDNSYSCCGGHWFVWSQIICAIDQGALLDCKNARSLAALHVLNFIKQRRRFWKEYFRKGK